MAKRIKAIFFDLGDTLVDFGKVNVITMFHRGAKLAHDYLLERGLPAPSFRAYHRRNLMAIRMHVVLSAISRREFNSRDIMAKVCRKMNLELTHEQLLELCRLWYEPLRQRASVEPGTREMLQRFLDDGIKLVIVSNTFIPGEVLDQHLQTENLLDILPIRIYSCNTKFKKPNRKIFQMALDEAQAEPQNTMFVGDTPRTDISGSNKMGMVSVLKDPVKRYSSTRYKPAHRIQRIMELPDIVRKYNG
ncbi:MAG: HAD family hydrolase [Phycisphaerae bacterium]|nr:HAD family hydrolase [Phycisphaerae bacterium]